LVSVRPFCPGRGVSVLRPLRSLGEGRFRACGTCGNELVTLKVYSFGFIAEVYRGEPMGRGPGWLERGSTSDCNPCGIIHGEFKNCMPTRLRARHEPQKISFAPAR
jgi:hypothetical protein